MFRKGLLLLGFFILCTYCTPPPSPSYIPIHLAKIDFLPNGHPVDMVFNAQTKLMYITNTRGDHIGVFKDLEQVATIPSTGDEPRSLAVDKANGWIYAVNYYSNNVTVIQDVAMVGTVTVAGRGPQAIAVETQRGWAYVVAGHNTDPPFGARAVVGSHVTILQGTEVIGHIELGPFFTDEVVADPVSGYVYVGSNKGQVFVLDGLDVIAQHDVHQSVYTMDVNPQTGDVYVLNSAGDRNLTRFHEGRFKGKVGFKENGRGASEIRNMQVHPMTGDVYVVDSVAHEVIVVRNMRIKARTPVGSGALKMVIDPITGNVYMANFWSNNVAVIHGTDTLGNIDVGWYPYGIGVNSNNGWVYVSNTNDDTVTVLGYRDGVTP